MRGMVVLGHAGTVLIVLNLQVQRRQLEVTVV